MFRRRKCSQVCQWVCANEAYEEIINKKVNNTKATQFVDCLSHIVLSSSDEDEESSYYEYTSLG